MLLRCFGILFFHSLGHMMYKAWSWAPQALRRLGLGVATSSTKKGEDEPFSTIHGA